MIRGMSSESFGLPEEITLTEGFHVDEEGKQYLYEKDGVKYGGDFLAESPSVISLDDGDFPPAPQVDINNVL